MVESILTSLLNLSPLFAVLAVVIIYLYKAYISKDKEISTLNDEIKENNKENLKLLYKVLGFFEKIENDNQDKHQDVINEIRTMQNNILNKLNNVN